MTRSEEIKELKEFLINLGIKRGDKIMVTSSILSLLISLKKKKLSFTPLDIIKILIDIVGKNGTLLFPVFNWDFCKGYDYHYKNTKSLSGALGNIALNLKDFKRTKNPIYSFAVFGKDRNKICNMSHNDCFSLNSPFGYIIKNNGKHLFIGIDYTGGFTPAHVAEQVVKVSYRFFKKFTGNCIYEKNKKIKKTVLMYVRKLNLNVMTGINYKFKNILKKNNAFEEKNHKNIIFNIINSKISHHLMVKDIKKNGGMIYPKKIK